MNLTIETLPDGGAILRIPPKVNVTESAEYRKLEEELHKAKALLWYALWQQPDSSMKVALYDLDSAHSYAGIEAIPDPSGIPVTTYRAFDTRKRAKNA